MGRFQVRRVARILGKTAATGAVGGAAAGICLYNAKPGFERAVRFWCGAGPIVADYWWQRFCATDETDAEARFEKLNVKYAPHVRQIIEDLRGMFIKVGQVLSVRPEAVPDAIRAELRKLQDCAPPARWEAIKETLERDLGASIDDIFEHINPEPLGAASIGQAHLVKWKGQQAVVKVKYPDADEMLRADFWCLETLLWLLNKSEALSLVSLLRQQFEVELDYSQEAQNLEQAHAALSLAPDFRDRIAVPKPIPELTSGSVIGMSYLPGPKLETVLRARLEALGVDMKDRSFNDLLRAGQGAEPNFASSSSSSQPSWSSDLKSNSAEHQGPSALSSGWGRTVGRILGLDLSLSLVRIFVELKLRIRSFFVGSPVLVGNTSGGDYADLTAMLRLLLDVHGFQLFFCPFFNGDPHPGNILMLPDGRVGLIDFGQCKRITDKDREALAHLFAELASAPPDLDVSQAADERIARAFQATGVRSKNSEADFLAFLPRLFFCSIQSKWLEPGYLKGKLSRDRVETMPTHVIMVYRSAMLLRGLCLTMQHNISVADVWGVWASRWLDLHAPRST
eukprot:TRINITY_DN43989_c0_g1_i1.p1 TRINITY_DN43989_c0_g1~~TRINITY_DN43989_c0_g1_i1.p1  ORF type:complete len:577 (+),score=81.20 TRINITY_DN43989_c0_g1_i1:32-1732(+)